MLGLTFPDVRLKPVVSGRTLRRGDEVLILPDAARAARAQVRIFGTVIMIYPTELKSISPVGWKRGNWRASQGGMKTRKNKKIAAAGLPEAAAIS